MATPTIMLFKHFPQRDCTVKMTVVLRDFGVGTHRYVTHCRNDADGSYFWGHYFSDETKAREDFHTRCETYSR